MSIKKFYVGTCENNANNMQPIVIESEDPFELIQEDPFKPFLIQDPFGLRKAIIPVFKRNIDGVIIGMGTGFHIDGWGTFLTADHVIEFAREYPRSASTWTDISQNSSGDRVVLLLGMGLGFSMPSIPKEAFALVEGILSPMQEKDNPLFNRTEPKNLADIAVLTAAIQSDNPDVPQPHFIPVRGSRWSPSIGETVLAIGFPELKCQSLDDHDQEILLREGMYGAYGCIRDIHPSGKGGNLTPVFEVDCNWLSGMSGGPVFNSLGEVIGLVSRAMGGDPDTSDPGIGWATCFGLIPYFSNLVPTLDILNPTWRKGWAVLKRESWHLAGFFKTETEARQLANSMDAGYEVIYGSNKFGTYEFVLHSSQAL
jgi:serine protease Do